MRAEKNFSGSMVVFGDINVDIIGRVGAWPEPGQDCLAPQLELHCGGVGVNTALALRRWEIETRLIGCVGEDDFGGFVLKALKEGGVDARLVQKTTRALTGIFYINVTSDGQRTFFGSRGANRLTRLPQAASATLNRSVAAHLMGYNFLDRGPEKTAGRILKSFHARGKWVSLDVGMEPSQKIRQKILRLLPQIDILFVSGDEAAAITGQHAPRRSFQQFQRAGAGEVVMKLGERGCLISQDGALREVPSFAVRTVDSTGAGDAFTAAFLQARLRGWSALEGALLANAAGAAAASVVGAGAMLSDVKRIAGLLRAQRFHRTWDTVRLQVLARLRNSGSFARRLR